MNITISTILSPLDLQSLNELFRQHLSKESDPPTMDGLRKTMRQGTRFVIAKDGRDIIGFSCLVPCHLLRFSFGMIHDVVVNPAYRGNGIGRNMVQLLLNQSVRDGLKFVDLTSRPNREKANRLYLDLGFERRETNAYRWHSKLGSNQVA